MSFGRGVLLLRAAAWRLLLREQIVANYFLSSMMWSIHLGWKVILKVAELLRSPGFAHLYFHVKPHLVWAGLLCSSLGLWNGRKAARPIFIQIWGPEKLCYKSKLNLLRLLPHFNNIVLRWRNKGGACGLFLILSVDVAVKKFYTFSVKSALNFLYFFFIHDSFCSLFTVITMLILIVIKTLIQLLAQFSLWLVFVWTDQIMIWLGYFLFVWGFFLFVFGFFLSLLWCTVLGKTTQQVPFSFHGVGEVRGPW